MLEGPSGSALAKTCVEKLAAFLRDSDQNRGFSLAIRVPPCIHVCFSVKYISLLALVKIVPVHPHLVTAYQDEIVASVDDQDISIRMRALDLISSMASISRILFCLLIR